MMTPSRVATATGVTTRWADGRHGGSGPDGISTIISAAGMRACRPDGHASTRSRRQGRTVGFRGDRQHDTPGEDSRQFADSSLCRSDTCCSTNTAAGRPTEEARASRGRRGQRRSTPGPQPGNDSPHSIHPGKPSRRYGHNHGADDHLWPSGAPRPRGSPRPMPGVNRRHGVALPPAMHAPMRSGPRRRCAYCLRRCWVSRRRLLGGAQAPDPALGGVPGNLVVLGDGSRGGADVLVHRCEVVRGSPVHPAGGGGFRYGLRRRRSPPTGRTRSWRPAPARSGGWRPCPWRRTRSRGVPAGIPTPPHRDIKPANVMVTSIGAKVVDFGIAAAAGPGDPDDVLLGSAVTAAVRGRRSQPRRIAATPARLAANPCAYR
jgi:hypothetical protein